MRIKIFETLKSAILLRKYVAGKIKPIESIKIENKRLTLLGQEAFIIPLRSWGVMIKGLMETHGPGILSCMKIAYKENGKMDAQDIKRIVPIKKIGKLFQLWVDLGWITEIVDIKVGPDEKNLREIKDLERVFAILTKKDKLIKVKIKGSVSSRAIKSVMKKVKFPACVFEPSYCSGVIEAVTGRKCEVEETKCEGKGDKFCEWIFTLK